MSGTPRDPDARQSKTAQSDAGHRDQYIRSQVAQEETMVTRFDGIAYSMFGEFFSERRDRFKTIEEYLKQARLPIDTDLYLSRMTLGTVVATIFAYFFIIPLTFGYAFIGGFDAILAGGVPAPLDAIVLITGLLLAFGAVFTMMGLTGAYLNLKLRASNRKRELDRTTPFAVTFMYALSRGGMNFVEVLDTLSHAQDTYGEVALEIDSIMRDMEYMSIDLPRALRRGANRTPSEKLETFLDDTVGVIDSGADLTKYLEDKSEDMLMSAEKDQQNFLTVLALLGEVYVTLFVAGPLFLIIITVIMAMLGGGAISQLYGIVYMLLPVMNIGFFILIDTITMDEKKLASTITGERSHKTAEETREAYERNATDDDSRVEAILEAKEEREKSRWRRDPLGWLLEKPIRTAIVSIPVGVLWMIGVVLSLGVEAIGAAFMTPGELAAGAAGPVEMTAYLFVIPLVLVLLPMSVFYEVSARRRKKMLSRMPDALKQLAASNDIGMTLTESLNTVANGTGGKLGSELEKVGNDIHWYHDVNSALIEFANRVKLPVVARTMKLITEANQSTGDIAEVLSVAARDVNKRQQLRTDRSNEMMMYTAVVLISFGVYLFVIAMLDVAFLSEIAKIGASGSAGAEQAGEVATGGSTGGGGMGFNLSDLPVDRFRMVFYHSTVIQAIGSGLLAGQLGKNEVMAGLKYSILLIIVSTTTFMVM